ncbi:hypothetical protein KA005_83335 [bacterium]|nr:hypothetical protein [bacterium]
MSEKKFMLEGLFFDSIEYVTLSDLSKVYDPWYIENHIDLLEVGESIKTDFREITRIKDAH